MHELSIAGAIVDIATAHAADRRVHAISVRVGHLRQVVPSALELAFELASAGTPVEGARLELEAVPAAGSCRACGRESELDAFPLACRACGSLDIDVVRGEELQVDSLEVDEMAVSA